MDKLAGNRGCYNPSIHVRATGDLGTELSVAVLAAAAAAILEHRTRPAISTKPDGSPVTSADLAADAVIRATVRAAFPGDAILSEEELDDSARLWSRRCWIADPLDGTRHFIAGSDDFDTFLTLVVDGTPVVAVTLQLATGLLLGAVAGQWAWMQVGDGPRRCPAIATSPARRLATKAWFGAPREPARAHGPDDRRQSLLQPTFSLCSREPCGLGG